jgi:hypothetical protein
MKPDHDPDDCDVIACHGGAKPQDKHLASIVHCVDDEIIEWLARRERRRRRHGPRNQIKPSARARYRLGVTNDRRREVSLRANH